MRPVKLLDVGDPERHRYHRRRLLGRAQCRECSRGASYMDGSGSVAARPDEIPREQTVARTAIANFNTVKAAACLQQSSNSTYCVTDLLDKVQSGLNTQLTVSSLTSLSLSDLEKIPSSEVCDDCAHALTTKLLPVIESATTSSSAAGASGVSSSSISSAIGGYCGQSFLDGQVPSDIKQGSGSSSSSSSSGNGAVSSTSLTGGAGLSSGSWSKVAGVAGVGLAAAVMLV